MCALKIGRRPSRPEPTASPGGRTGIARVLLGPGQGGEKGAARTSRGLSGDRQPIRTRTVAVVLWTLLGVAVLGGLLGFSQLVKPTEGPKAAPLAAITVPDAGAGGFAALFMQTWLPTGQGTERSLQRFMNDIPDLGGVTPNRLLASSTTPVQISPAGAPGYWSVTVAVNAFAVKDDKTTVPVGLRFYQVPVAACGSVSGSPSCPPGTASPGYTVVAAPSLVAGPGGYKASETDSGKVIAVNSPPGDTVRRFLAAYLAGDGELARYCPTCAPLAAPVLSRVDVTEMRATGDSQQVDSVESGTIPAEGTELMVQATARGVDSAGVAQALSYPLRLVVRANQWTVAAVTAAPPLAPPKTGTSSASTSAPAPSSSSPAPATR